MDLFFVDDSRQKKPSRKGMHPLVAIGGIHVPSNEVLALENELNALCHEGYGFPEGEMFKWSPGTELWMRNNLVEKERLSFFIDVIGCLKSKNIEAIVIVEDTNYNHATVFPPSTGQHELDALILFLERAQLLLTRDRVHGLVVIDRPGGSRKDEEQLLLSCFETLREGTKYLSFDRIPLNVMTTASRHMRSLQAADLIVGCVTARVSGEDEYSVDVFEEVRDILLEEFGRIGGCGLKIHPDSRYTNLYHWLCGDEYTIKGSTGYSLPWQGYPYCESPQDP